MKPKQILLYFLIVTLASASVVSCCKTSFVSDYEYRQARDAYDDDEYDHALEMIEKQLRTTPDHIGSIYLRAVIHHERKEYAQALTDICYVIRHYRENPNISKSQTYGFRGINYRDMGNYADAAIDFKRAARLARKDDPGQELILLNLETQMYFQQGDLKAADKVYHEILKRHPENCMAKVGLARSLKEIQRYEESLALLEEVEKQDPYYSSASKFKMQVLDALGRTDESIDAGLRFYDLDEDVPVSYVGDYLLKHYSYAVAKVRTEANKAESFSKWTVLLTYLYEKHGDYQKAINLYNDIIKEHGEYEEILYRRSQCYDELGECKKAVADLTRAYELSDDMYYIGARGDAYRNAGFYEQAISDYQACMDDDPSEGFFYYAIGWSYELSGDKVKAMQYYNEGIDIDKSYPYLYLSRGDLLKGEGRLEEAKADYERVVALDTIAQDGTCREYALLSLGRKEEAIDWINQLIAKEPMDGGHWYDKACLYGRMGDLEGSLSALDTALQRGYREFRHLEDDDDMDPIRDLPRFKQLVEDYRFAATHPMVEADPFIEIPDADPAKTISEIPMRKKPGGTYEVACSINGLPLKFIFDTGASDVSISSVEADFMLKNDYLTAKDFRGSRTYMTASGNICDGAIICLKEIQVGDLTLKNIEASVIKNQKAPLLLGQSALERFGTITIDNENSKLIIKH